MHNPTMNVSLISTVNKNKIAHIPATPSTRTLQRCRPQVRLTGARPLDALHQDKEERVDDSTVRDNASLDLEMLDVLERGLARPVCPPPTALRRDTPGIHCFMSLSWVASPVSMIAADALWGRDRTRLA